MPLYEYACRDCEHTFETLVYDGESVECPECQSDRLERLLSVPAKPRADVARSLPSSSSCDPKLPPCGPGCCRM
jgi:putative FmdB family regulatory protein